MTRKKQQKYHNYIDLPNSIEFRDETFVEIQKNKETYRQDKKIILDIACGKAETTLWLANEYPDSYIVAIDRRGDRMLQGARKALELQLANVTFIRIIAHNIHELFPEKSIYKIFLFHPDPRRNKGEEKQRMTNQRFLEMYKRLLREDGELVFQTDDKNLFDRSREQMILGEWKISEEGLGSYKPENRSLTTFEKRGIEEGSPLYRIKLTL